MKKRLLSLALCLCMALQLVPALGISVGAADVPQVQVESEIDTGTFADLGFKNLESVANGVDMESSP